MCDAGRNGTSRQKEDPQAGSGDRSAGGAVAGAGGRRRAPGTGQHCRTGGPGTAARRSGTYGNYLRISHPGGQETGYAHMQHLYVRAGEVVSAGQCLGTAGQTGRSTGAHLHFEFLTQGIRYDPAKALGLP